MRFVDAISCYPMWPFIVVAAVLATPPSKATLSGFVLAAIAGMLFWPRITRLIATVDDVRTVVPAVFNQAARDLTQIIVLLATIDFFGLGIQPPTPSWGNMLVDAQEYITVAWWAGVFPPFCIFGAVLAIEIVRRRFLAVDGTLSGRNLGNSAA
jgi:ABC-type dipeptide/oligopeptide/nickel transport system permease subunit